MSPPGSNREPLTQHRAAAAQRLAALERDLAEMMEASRDSNADDEHDPEGSTIAFEREQLATLIERARQRVVDLDAAEERLRDGSYGRCTSCGGPIGATRLEALPTTSVCRECA